MKVILTGSTGFIGGEVLKQCLANPQIDSLVVLSRRDLPQLIGKPKAKVIIMKDFTLYSPDVVKALEGSDACIWSLGTYHGDPQIELDYPRAFFDAIVSAASFNSRSKPFHHVHLSGAVAEPDQNKPLWYFSRGRKTKGLAQTKIVEYANDSKARGKWNTYIVRPGYVLPAAEQSSWYSSIIGFLLTSHYSVRNDELGITMTDLAVNGGTRPILSSTEIGIQGRKLLAKRAS